MKIVLKIFNWIFSIFCITSLMAYGLTIPSILMAVLGIVSLPVEVIRGMWKKLPAHKILRPVIIFILFIAFCCMIPTDNVDTEITENSRNIVIEESEDPVGLEMTADTEEKKESVPIEKSIEEQIEEETIKAESETIEESTEQEQADAKQIETEKPTTSNVEENSAAQTKPSTETALSVASIPAYSGNPYVIINDNIPQFLDTDMSTVSYEYYSPLDALGRCGVVYACIGQDLMPTEERGSIGHVKPTGWHTVKYDNVDGKYLYNRCHLIGYQLSGENANTGNLITGTRYLNVDGMLPFENMVADYVQETGNHVMYRVTPIFEGNNLLASGVQMEAKSVEDNGDGILFNVYCYNVQPGIIIDYASGNSNSENVQANVQPEPTPQPVKQTQQETQSVPEEPQSVPVVESNVQQNSIIANKNSKAFHRNTCSRLPKEKNRVYLNSREEALAAGFDNPCDYCNP